MLTWTHTGTGGFTAPVPPSFTAVIEADDPACGTFGLQLQDDATGLHVAAGGADTLDEAFGTFGDPARLANWLSQAARALRRAAGVPTLFDLAVALCSSPKGGAHLRAYRRLAEFLLEVDPSLAPAF